VERRTLEPHLRASFLPGLLAEVGLVAGLLAVEVADRPEEVVETAVGGAVDLHRGRLSGLGHAAVQRRVDQGGWGGGSEESGKGKEGGLEGAVHRVLRVRHSADLGGCSGTICYPE